MELCSLLSCAGGDKVRDARLFQRLALSMFIKQFVKYTHLLYNLNNESYIK